MPQPLYILQGRKVVPVYNQELWQAWIQAATASGTRLIATTNITSGLRVTTVFLGFNIQIYPEQPLQVFETAIAGGGLDGFSKRTSTYEQAEAEHDSIVQVLRSCDPANFYPADLG